MRRLLEKLRGFEQRLLRGGPLAPLLLLSYPRAAREVAAEVESAWLRLLPSLSGEAAKPYLNMLERLPAVVVVLLRPTNKCGCLGHQHPAGAESHLAKRLASDLGSPVAEIDLAYENIARWQPRPLAALASPDPALPRLHFRAGLLTVLLHELDHVGRPDKTEHQVRSASDDLYLLVMNELLRSESGLDYGMAGPWLRP